MKLLKRTLMVLTVLVAVAFQPLARAQISPALISQALQRTVLLIILDKNGEELGICSGSFISPKGLILTAAHCVHAMDDMPKLGLKKGDLIRSDGMAIVALNPTDPGKVKPVLSLVATRVVDNQQLDVALLQVVGLYAQSGPKPLPPDFQVPFMALGDHDQISIAEEIAVLGFPGVGGDTVTVVKGNVTGFTADPNDHRYEMKHNAEAGPGASGGPVINQKSEVLAVHVSGYTDRKTTAKSYRAILTKPVLESLAQYLNSDPKLAGYLQGVSSYVLKTNLGSPLPAPAPVPTTPAPTSQPAPATLPAAPPPLAPPAPTAPAPPAPQPVVPTAPPVAPAPQETAPAPAPAPAVPQTGFSDLPSVPPPPPATAQATGSVVQTRILDATSGAGIEGALVGIFRPGVSADSATKDDIIAMGVADSRGYVQTSPAIPKNASYPVLIMAKGYSSIRVTLSIPADAPAILEKETVSLKRQ